jgi:hypothetical protein
MIVTVFDWDDTLMATTHLVQEEEEHKPVTFPELSTSIKQLLAVALELGHVYIITNAEIAWIQKCIEENLIDCDHILDRVHVLSTVDSGIAKITNLEIRKTVAFGRIKGMFNRRGAMHHLICMGDCFYDRDAAIDLRDKIEEHTYVKSVKFLHRPDVKTLLFQQKVCLDTFNTLLMNPQNLDLMLTRESPLPLPFIMQYSSLSDDQASELSDLSELTEEEGDGMSIQIEPESCCGDRESNTTSSSSESKSDQ